MNCGGRRMGCEWSTRYCKYVAGRIHKGAGELFINNKIEFAHNPECEQDMYVIANSKYVQDSVATKDRECSKKHL